MSIYQLQPPSFKMYWSKCFLLQCPDNLLLRFVGIHYTVIETPWNTYCTYSLLAYFPSSFALLKILRLETPTTMRQRQLLYFLAIVWGNFIVFIGPKSFTQSVSTVLPNQVQGHTRCWSVKVVECFSRPLTNLIMISYLGEVRWGWTQVTLVVENYHLKNVWVWFGHNIPCCISQPLLRIWIRQDFFRIKLGFWLG